MSKNKKDKKSLWEKVKFSPTPLKGGDENLEGTFHLPPSSDGYGEFPSGEDYGVPPSPEDFEDDLPTDLPTDLPPQK